MSLVGKTMQTDELYGTYVMMGIERAHAVLEVSFPSVSLFGELDGLYGTLEEMKYQTPFSVAPVDRLFPVESDGTTHRVGPWGVIDKALISALGSATCESMSERAKWCQNIIGLAKQWVQVQEHVSTLRHQLATLGLRFGVGEGTEPVRIIFDPEITGEQAYATLKGILSTLLADMASYLEDERKEEGVLPA